jgi:Rrf2 family protein
MAGFLEMSHATALGFHAMARIARSESRVSSEELAASIHASRAHLSKVLKALTDSGLLLSKRGPDGGYSLALPAPEVTLLQIYEALQGPLRLDGCLFDQPVCQQVHCVLGGLVEKVRNDVHSHMAQTTLHDVVTRQGR